MNLTDMSDRFLGRWSGAKELYFEGPPDLDSISDSTLVVAPIAMGRFLSFTYTWELKGTSHEGVLIVGNGNKEEVVTAAWVDSFHMSGKIMNCEGLLDEQGRVDVLGAYEAPPGPHWGWRIGLRSDGETLELIMHNISPDDEEVLAVRAVYARISA